LWGSTSEDEKGREKVSLSIVSVVLPQTVRRKKEPELQGDSPALFQDTSGSAFGDRRFLHSAIIIMYSQFCLEFRNGQYKKSPTMIIRFL
jgi:hypothetical protein